MHAARSEVTSLTVSQLNKQAKRLLESHFDYIWVEGEISNLAQPSSGHWYFSLKDSGAQVRCAMFRNRNQLVKIKPENGQQVRIRCRVSLYEGRGDFQLIVEFIEAAGAGALQAAFDQLKNRLGHEGLFDADRKQPLPLNCRNVGVITSPSGAAIRDILSTFERRFPAINISILPTIVQGADSGLSISSAIERANRLHSSKKIHFDVLIIGRGGGSIEDLWGFNDERVARAIYNSSIPIVSAIGHEVDFTIADFAADARAATPTAAAELLSPNQQEIIRELRKFERSLSRGIIYTVQSASSSLKWARSSLVHPGEKLRDQAQRLDHLETRLVHSCQSQIGNHRHQLAYRASVLLARSPQHTLNHTKSILEDLKHRLTLGHSTSTREKKQRLAGCSQLLNTISPLATLHRGYSIITDPAGEIVRRAEKLTTGTKIKAQLGSGSIHCRVESIEIEEKR